MAGIDCDTCMYYEYDDDYEGYVCTMSFDEDETARLKSTTYHCPYYRGGDEYTIVKKQI